MASISLRDTMPIEDIQDLQQNGWLYVAVYESGWKEDKFLVDLMFKPLPKVGEYIQLPNDKYRGRVVSFFLHPTSSPYDLFLFIGDAVH